MKVICNKNLCCGCESCKNICPKSAINMKEDIYGVKYPEINQEVCINCGMCHKVCPQLNEIKNNKVIMCYAAKRKSTKKRLDSASGGIAHCLYELFLKKEDSVVFGVEFNDDNLAEFKMTTKIEDLETFKGSKYVQANIGNLYTDVAKSLKSNKYVLVVGTPCQMAGIYKFLEVKNINTEKLFTIDLICHGVSPSKYLIENIEYLKNKYNWQKVKNITFRSNRVYKNFHFCLEGIADNKIDEYNRYSYEDPYFYAFLNGTSLRENCYNCKYTNTNRVGDITIGDFIGLGKQDGFEEYNDDSKENTSIVLINTVKGKQLFEEAFDQVDYKVRNINEALVCGTSLKSPFVKNPKRNEFLKLYPKLGFVKTMYQIFPNELNSNSKNFLLHSMKIKIGKYLDRKIERNEK